MVDRSTKVTYSRQQKVVLTFILMGNFLSNVGLFILAPFIPHEVT